MTAGAGCIETKSRKAAETVYAVLTCLSVFGGAAAMLTWSPGAVTPGWLTVIRCLSAALGLTLNRRKDLGFRLLAAYLALIFLRLLVPAPERMFAPQVSDTLLHGAWVFLGCWSLPFALDAKKAARVLRLITGGWCFCMAAMALVALYAAWRDREIWNISGGAFWGLDVNGSASARLKMFFDVNTSGVIFGQAVLLSFYRLLAEKNRVMKCLYAAALIPSWTALCLTDCRTAAITAGAGIAWMTALQAADRMRKKQGGKRRIPAWVRVAGAAAAAAVLCVGLHSGTTALFNLAKTSRRNFLLSGASAEAGQEFSVTVIPAEQTVGYDETAVLEVMTEGAEGRITYQWQVSTDGQKWTDLPTWSAKKKRMEISITGAGLYENRYRCAVTAGDRTEVSGEAVILKPFTLKISRSIKKRPEGTVVRLTAKTAGTEGKTEFRWLVRKDGDEDWTEMTGDEDAPNCLTVEISGEISYNCIAEAANGKVIGGGRVKYSSEASVMKRGLNMSDILSGRDTIWLQAGRFLLANPRTLAIGRSIAEPLKDTGIMRGQNETEHCHNGLLQTTMESGLPGLAIMAAFLAYAVICGIRLVRSGGMPSALRFLPAAVFPVWLGEMAECIARMSNTRAPVFFMLMLLTGFVCAAGGRQPEREAKTCEGKKDPDDPGDGGSAGGAGAGGCGAAPSGSGPAAEGSAGPAGRGQQELG